MYSNKKTAAIAVVGLGRFGTALAKGLCELGKEVLVIDESEAKIKELRGYTDYAFVCDKLTKEALSEAGIQNCEVVVVCIGQRIDVSILVTLHAVSLGVPKVIAKATSNEQGYVLEKIGAEVVYPEHDMAVRLAKRIVNNNVVDYLSLNNEIEISELKIINRYVGKSINEANIRKNNKLNIIAIKHKDDIITEIYPEYVFKENDIIVVIGKKENIQNFEALQ